MQGWCWSASTNTAKLGVLHGKRRTHNTERAVTRTPRLSQGSPAPAARDQLPLSLARRAASDPTAWGGGRGEAGIGSMGVNQTVGSGDLVLINHHPAVHTTAPKHSLQPPRVPSLARRFPVAACLPHCAIRSFEFAPAGRSVLSSDKAEGHRSSGGYARGPHQDGQTTRPQDHETARQTDR